MADANVHLEIGPQYVKAAKKAVEDAVAPFRNLDEYRIGASIDSGNWWPYVEHMPCRRDIWSNEEGDETGYLDTVMRCIAEHRCEAER